MIASVRGEVTHVGLDHVVVEVGTRRASAAQRELDLAESLAFARLHLAT